MKILSFKVSEDEVRKIRQLARKEGVLVPEYLRRRALGITSFHSRRSADPIESTADSPQPEA